MEQIQGNGYKAKRRFVPSLSFALKDSLFVKADTVSHTVSVLFLAEYGGNIKNDPKMEKNKEIIVKIPDFTTKNTKKTIDSSLLFINAETCPLRVIPFPLF